MNKTYYNGFENLKVSLECISENPYKIFWNWYKTTWISLQQKDYDEKDSEILKACNDVLNNRALPTPQEMIQLQFRITGLSRVGLAQITRGRIGFAYNVESQMPQHISHAVTIPKNLYRNPKYKERIVKLIKDSQQLYDEIYNDGIPPQDIRYLTIHGQQTQLIMGVNFLALRGFFAMRAENGLTDELNFVCRLILREIRNHIEENNDTSWNYLIEKLDCIGSDKKCCVNFDKVFGNTGRYKSVNESIPTLNGNIRCNYDFTKSAWFQELCEMDVALLFKDEKQMIERWKKTNQLLP